MAKEYNKTMKSENIDSKDYFEQYWRHCSALRNWFVAFGIGGCVLLISDKADIFKSMNSLRKVWIIRLFLFGVSLQIALAILNKWIHWCIYWGNEKLEFCNTKRHKIASKISECFIIDVAVDIFSSLSYLIAIYLIVTI